MKKMKFIAVLLCVTLVLPYSSAHAAGNNNQETESATLDGINSSKTETVYTSDESVFLSDVPTRSYGTYPIYTRVKIVQSSSNGLIQRDSQLGNYASIASLALSFAKYAAAMKVSTILSIVGLAAGQQTYVKAVTYTSYVQYVKQGQAKWGNESNALYTSWVYSGKRNHYKHILAATQKSNGQWTTKTYDYLGTPCKVDLGNFYNNSDTWFKEQARQRILTSNILDDQPW